MLDFIKSLNKKQKVLIIIILAVFALVIASKHRAETKQKELDAEQAMQEQMEEMEAEEEDMEEGTDEDNLMSEKEIEYQEEQAELEEEYGTPPEGFRLDVDGELVPLSDSNMSAEDVLYAYLRGVSTLSFADVQKYSYKSHVVRQYNNYYDKDNETSYDTEFKRTLYKDMLLSLEVEGASDTAVFADKKYIITASVKCLDLTDKQFWVDKSDEIFQNLYTYRKMEDDGTKANQYLYDFVRNYYESGNAKTVVKSIDFILERGEKGGWLVTDDSALDRVCQYTDGELVIDYIKNCYDDWYNDMLNNSY